MIKFVFCLRYGLGRILFEETSNFDFFLFFLFFSFWRGLSEGLVRGNWILGRL